MGYHDNKNSKKQRRQKSRQAQDLYTPVVNIEAEKRKARELRNSAWWKRKISSGKCYYCGKTFPPSELTMDHRIPIARGGLSEKENLVPACKECNNKKKYLLPTEWDEYMEGLKNNNEE